MRLIDADALIEDIKSFWDWDSIDGITATTVLKQTMTDISNAPTIDAVPVRHGKWIDKSGGIEGAWNYCSVCGERAIELYDYCPNCGAKMDEEEP